MTDFSKITNKFDLQKIISDVKTIKDEAMTKINAVIDALHQAHKAPDAAAPATAPTPTPAPVAAPVSNPAPTPEVQALSAGETK